MWKGAFFWRFCLLGLFFEQALCQVTITTQTSTVSGNTGENVHFPCDVQNKTNADIVVWEFVDHNITIATGTDVRVQDGSLSKYEIFKPQDSSSEFHWYLRINDLEVSDVGSYRCYVSGPGSKTQVVHHLVIEDAPSRLTAPPSNIMDCCVEKNVDTCIYPLCNRANYTTLDFIGVLTSDTCVNDNLLTVLECGQGGRNSLGCCIRSGISEKCQNLCEGWGVQDGTNYEECIGPEALTIATCYDTGIAYLPSQPTSVTAVSSSDGFTAYWKQPLQNSDKVTKYKVRYRQKDTEHYNIRTTQDAMQLSLQVTNLVDTQYEFDVIAAAGQGASQPSYSVEIAVKGGQTNQEITETIYDCCSSKGVSAACINYCSADTLRRGGHPDSFVECFGELDKIYSCLANQGNHTPCCSRYHVPNTCFPLCEGRVNLNWNVSLCLPYMNRISSCIIEGSGYLPSPPFNTRIVPGSIKDTSVSLAWQQPDDFEDGNYFVVGWRLHSHAIETDWNTVSVEVGNSYTITGLLPAEVYDAIVATENNNGSSLPELTLVFVTEAIGYDKHPPYNETVCCIDRGVQGNCLDICYHDFRLTNTAVDLAFACASSVLPMLQCASDGRNHTDCCVREGLPNNCLGLCSLHPEEVPSTELLPCIMYKNQLSTCFDEGKGVLPNTPIGITVKDIEEYSITVDWQKPAGPIVTNYTVQYSTEYGSWPESSNANETYFILYKLMADTTYYIRVSANNMNGTSFPSEIIVAYTLPVPINQNGTFDWDAVWKNRSECCSNSDISTACIAGCNNGDLLNVNQCIGDLHKILACGADGRDHTKCCSRSPDFPTACLSYCSGQIPPQDGNTALCLAYKDAIFTCFTNGEGLLPTPPIELSVKSLAHDQITIQWNNPARNCYSNCMYVVLIWQDGGDITRMIISDRLTYTFLNIEAQTEYRISVLATNAYGSSLPAPYIIVRSMTDPFTGLTLAQFPDGVVDISVQFVQLECTTTGESNSTVWRRNDKIVSQTNLYRIQNLTKADEGLYSCEASFSSGKKTKDTFLNIRYLPEADSMSEDMVLPGLDQTARINCTFKGFPENVYWSKDGTNLTDINKYLFEPFQPDLKSGKSMAVLRIRSVMHEDFGSYTCIGVNAHGHRKITGELKNLTPTIPIPPRVNMTVADCCEKRNVPPACSSKICTYTLDLNAIIYDTSLLYCLDYFNDFIACGTDGKDHSMCCSRKGVSDYCLNFCAGQVPSYETSWELVQCMEHVGDIGDCLVDGASNIPTSPQDFSAQMEFDSVSVTWLAPSQNADKVTKYDIYYQPSGTDKPIIETVSSSKSQYDLPVAIKGMTYTVWGRAVNNFGQSAETGKVTVSVTTLVPRKPTSLMAKLIQEVNIRVNWQCPKQSNARITGYKIIYWRTNLGRKTAVQAVVGNILNTRLDGLMPNTIYSIVVVARSDDGYGQETEVKKVATMKGKETSTLGPAGYADNNQGNVGLAVGLVCTIVFLIAIGFVVVLFYRRRFQRKHPIPNSDTVAFENPSFGNQRSGLPSENGESNQYGYANLKEEQDNEQVHLSFGNSMTSNSSKDTPATLDVTS